MLIFQPACSRRCNWANVVTLQEYRCALACLVSRWGWPEHRLFPRGLSCLLKIILSKEEGARLQSWCTETEREEGRFWTWHGVVSLSILCPHPEPRACVSNIGSQAVLHWNPACGLIPKREIPSHCFAVNSHAARFLQDSGVSPDGSGRGAPWDQGSFHAFLRQTYRLTEMFKKHISGD